MIKINYLIRILPLMVIICLGACRTIPKGAVAVSPFQEEKYLGQWYEIARLDFRFEKDMINVTANYSLNDDGSIKVVNRGYDVKDKKWEESEGKAKFVDSTNEAKLEVSFFGPFYSGYNVIAIDPDYKYALVAGKDLNYLWILSRDKTIPEDIKQNYLKRAQEIGYDTSKLIWTQQN